MTHSLSAPANPPLYFLTSPLWVFFHISNYLALQWRNRLIPQFRNIRKHLQTQLWNIPELQESFTSRSAEVTLKANTANVKFNSRKHLISFLKLSVWPIVLDFILSALSLVSIIARCITYHTLGDPRAVSPVGRKGATKVSKYGRKTSRVETLTRPFLNGQANAIVLHSCFLCSQSWLCCLNTLTMYWNCQMKILFFLILFSTDVF